MASPNVSISLLNGGLNLQAPSAFGDSALLVASPAAPVAGYGVAFLVKSKKQVEVAFGQVGNEAVVTAVSAFYDEAPEGTPLHVLAMAQTTALATLLAAANADKPLIAAAGSVRLVAAIKFPAVGYTPTVLDGFDTDVHNAATAAQTLANAWQAQNKPFRCLIEGWGFTNIAAVRNYATASLRNVGIVVGSVDNSTAMATMLALGRAARVEPQQNIGRVKTGSLNIASSRVVRIGTTVVDNVPKVDVDTLHDKRYIFPVRNETAPGYVWVNDNMLTAPTDDYNRLANGRVIDNATRIAYSTYYRELKDDVDVDEGGRLAAVAEKALENAIEQAIGQQIGGQLSANADGTPAVQCLVNPDATVYPQLYEDAGISNPNFNLLQTGTVYLFVRMRPKGSLQFINVFLGFSADVS